MRKTIGSRILVPVLAVLALAGFANASSIGGLASPLNESEASMAVVMGYSQRDVKDGIKDEARSKRFLLKGAYGIGHGTDIYVTLGLSDINYKDANFSGSLGQSFGAGVRFSPTEFADGTKLVFDLDGDYVSSTDGSNRVTSQTYRGAGYIVGKFGSSGKFGYFFPYAGLSISTASYNNPHYSDYKASQNIGLIGGTDFFINPNVFFTLEFHIFDESAAYLTAGYRF